MPRAGEHSSADDLIAVLSEMMAEMGRSIPADQGSILDASLDRDLGFDSLSRMELVHRAEQVFGVTLADDVIGRAETPPFLRVVKWRQGKRRVTQLHRFQRSWPCAGAFSG